MQGVSFSFLDKPIHRGSWYGWLPAAAAAAATAFPRRMHESLYRIVAGI